MSIFQRFRYSRITHSIARRRKFTTLAAAAPGSLRRSLGTCLTPSLLGCAPSQDPALPAPTAPRPRAGRPEADPHRDANGRNGTAAQCGNHLPALTENWTLDAASRSATVQITRIRPSPRRCLSHARWWWLSVAVSTLASINLVNRH